MFNHQSLLKQFDTIVIGSGISGLTASLIMAKEGKKVALFERDDDIAPLIRPYKRKGCAVSPGLHFCGWMDEGEVVTSFLNYLQVADGVERVLYHDEFLNVDVGPIRYQIPRGFERVREKLSSYFPEDKEAIGLYLRFLRTVNEETFYFNPQLLPDINAGHDFMGPSNFTLEEFLKRHHASQGLLDLLSTLNYVLIGSKANEVPFTTHAFAIGGFYQSPGFFSIDGINRLLANFKRELDRFGVRRFVHTEVEKILVDPGKNAAGIRTIAGDEYSSSSVIASFNPKLLGAMIEPNTLRPIYRQRLNEAEDTFGFFVAFYKIADDSDIEIENIIGYDDVLDSHIIITSNISGDTRILCVFLADNSRNNPIEADGRRRRALEKLESLEGLLYAKIPALKGKMILLDYCKPWSFERYTKTVNGSAYGIKHTINTMGFHHKAPIRGLYLIGQAIFPGFLGSMISSFSLACEMLEADKFWPRVVNHENA